MASGASSVIDDFLKQYDKSLYEQLAKRAQEICSSNMDSSSPIIFAHRGKEPESLEKKLKDRDRHKHYRSMEDIREDIVDLAGVRISYMPQDWARIDDVIRKNFDIQLIIEHPDGRLDTTSDKSSLDYQASHYRVRLSGSQLRGLEGPVRTLQNPTVEIQVLSILNHVWAHVQHGIEYKPLRGPPSSSHRAMLNIIKQTMQLGESQLKALQDIEPKWPESQDKTFANEWELGSWLFNWLSRTPAPEKLELGPIEVLRMFVSLRKVDKKTPNKLELVLREMRFGSPWPSWLQTLSDKLNKGENRASILVIAYIMQKDFVPAGSHRAFAVPKSQPAYELKVKMMASSFIWLSEIYPQTSHWIKPVTDYIISKERNDDIKWLLNSVMARQIMAGEADPSKSTMDIIDRLWNWMEDSSIEMLCFVFSMSKMGVCRNFPKEDQFMKLKAVYGVFGKFF